MKKKRAKKILKDVLRREYWKHNKDMKSLTG
jgi:hypothetical protein